MAGINWTLVAAAILALDRMRNGSVARASRAVGSLWQRLQPTGLWNDGLAAGAAAREAMLLLSLVESMRRLGWSYGRSITTAMGSAPTNGRQAWLPTRLGADPFAEAWRVADDYRHQALENHSVRPETFTQGADGQAALTWLRNALERDTARIDHDAQESTISSTLRQYDGSGFTAYMRVPHPMASKSGTCGLCWAASLRTYRVRDLMPLHAHCHCTVMPISVSDVRHLPFVSQDQFGDLTDRNAQLLRRIYLAANGGSEGDWLTDRQSLANVRMSADGTITLHEGNRAYVSRQPEIGPTFTAGRGHGSWHMPAASDAAEQLSAMAARSDGLDRLYRSALKGRTARGTVLGHGYEIRPASGLADAARANRSLGRVARQRLRDLA